MRVMFTQNRNVPSNLTPRNDREEYFILYYQFLKHAFGLQHAPTQPEKTRLRFYLDQLPDQSIERKKQFKGYMAGLNANYVMRKTQFTINEEDISEIDSQKHIILQCVDLVLGSISFRLNDKHKAIAPNQRIRGKRTRAKEDLYQFIRTKITHVTGKSHFNTGMSTGLSSYPRGRWIDPYLHWKFVPSEHEIDKNKSKKK